VSKIYYINSFWGAGIRRKEPLWGHPSGSLRRRTGAWLPHTLVAAANHPVTPGYTIRQFLIV